MDESQAGSFFDELKRRKVVRVGIAYAGVVMGVLEFAQYALELFGISGPLYRALLFAAVTGFPVVLVLAWVFDLSAEGLERTPDLAPVGASASSDSFAPRFARQLVVTGAIVVLAMTGVGWKYMPNDRVDLVANQVAVMPFENQDGDPELDQVGVIVATDVARGLGQLDGLKAVPVQQAMNVPDPALAADGNSMTHVQAVAEATRASLVVTGTYFAAGEELVFQATVYNAAKRTEIFSSEPIRGRREDPTHAFEELRESLFGFLGQLSGVVGSDVRMAAALERDTPTYAAYREVAVGWELFRPLPLEAARHFEAAATIDPTYGDAMYWAAVAYNNGRRLDLAVPLVAQLESMRADLTPYTRASLDYMQAHLRGDLEGAYTAAGRVAALVGTSPEAWTAGSAALATNRPKEAIEYYLRVDLDILGPLWPPTWGTWAAAQHLLGQYSREQRLLRAARVQYPKGFIAGELRTLAARGKDEEVWRRIEGYDLGGLDNRQALSVADEFEAHGDPDAADRMRARVLERVEALSADEPTVDSLRFERGLTLLGLQRDAEARAVLDSLLEASPQNPGYQVNAGIAAARTGDRDRAETAIAWLGGLSPRFGKGGLVASQARIAGALGEAERAVRLLRQAEELGRQMFQELHRDHAFRDIRDHPAFVAYGKPRG